MKILLAVDGSPYTKKMLAYLSTHAELLAGQHEFTALTVQAALPNRARAALGKDTVEQYYAEEAEKILAPVRKYLARHGVEIAGLSKVGPAGETIAKAADSGKYDLLIMGSHGNSSFANLVLGSVATKVLANSKVPVLLVR